jgi:hypothetical protein
MEFIQIAVHGFFTHNHAQHNTASPPPTPHFLSSFLLSPAPFFDTPYEKKRLVVLTPPFNWLHLLAMP